MLRAHKKAPVHGICIEYLLLLYDFSALEDVCTVSRSEGMLEFWQHLEYKLWSCLRNIFGREKIKHGVTR
jgi:hypothetical protein